MRDHVEIGIGREARRTYGLDEISLVPARRTRSSKDVSTQWKIDAYSFDLPFVSEPTDALASPEFVIEMDKQGGLGVINAEGLWGRCADLAGAIEEITSAAGEALFADDAGSETFYRGVEAVQRLHAAPLDHDLLAERIAQVAHSGATVAVRVSPQHAAELAPVVIKAGAEILFVQGTLISAEHVRSGEEEPLNLKTFISSLDVPVIAGNVTNYTTALHLMRTGAAGVIVGNGDNTNRRALGIGAGQATAIADAAAARRDYLDETGGRYVHVISDGNAIEAGEIAKSIACGADAVMLGRALADALEAAGHGVYWSPVAGHPRYPRGDVAPKWGSDLVPLQQLLHGPSASPAGDRNLAGGLRRAMAKCGYTDLKSFQRVGLQVGSPLF